MEKKKNARADLADSARRSRSVRRRRRRSNGSRVRSARRRRRRRSIAPRLGREHGMRTDRKLQNETSPLVGYDKF